MFKLEIRIIETKFYTWRRPASLKDLFPLNLVCVFLQDYIRGTSVDTYKLLLELRLSPYVYQILFSFRVRSLRSTVYIITITVIN